MRLHTRISKHNHSCCIFSATLQSPSFRSSFMVFSSLTFIHVFLPSVFVGYYLLLYLLSIFKIRALAVPNAFLLMFSVAFYAYGEPRNAIVAALVTMVAFASAFIVGPRPSSPPAVSGQASRARSFGLVVCVSVLIAPLIYYKYNRYLSFIHPSLMSASGVLLPLGISFFTFQAISYVVDVFRGEARPTASPVSLLLYIFFFPQLIAGPIVRYVDVEAALKCRQHSLAAIATGIRRFAIGLGKKVLLANTLSGAADAAFSAPSQVACLTAWAGLLAYSLQLYLDFSGYSDMAIGLGEMFGFSLPENFNNPYSSTSITEFWRRWHITLSEWFRDYLYVPLGGNRCGAVRTTINLWVVFALCGLWHGPDATFLAWGLFHGLFLSIERLVKPLRVSVPRLVGWVWTCAVISMGWVIFRSPDVGSAEDFFQALISLGDATRTGFVLTPEEGVAFAVGSLLCVPAVHLAVKQFITAGSFNKSAGVTHRVMSLIMMWVTASLLYASSCVLASGASNPFIYYRF